MGLSMPSPTRIGNTFYLRLRPPADVVAKVYGKTVNVSVGGKQRPVTVKETVKVSLGTADPREASLGVLLRNGILELIEIFVGDVRLDALAISQSRDKGEAYPPEVRTPELLQANEPEPISLRKLIAAYSASRAKVGKGAEAMKCWNPVYDDLIAFLKHDNVLKITDQTCAIGATRS